MDALGLTLVFLTTAVLIVLGGLENLQHRRNLGAFRFRIHVNGTRGKSSVTRLIAAGLRAGGVRTCAKTTGTLPRLIHPDGVEEPIYRVGPPNVIEQLSVIRRARHLKAEAIVVECMALQPFLQWVSTASLVRPTHGVITNVRADHLDVMGPTTWAVGDALAGSIPMKSQLFTSENRYVEPLRQACTDRQTELVIVRPEDEPVTEDELARFRYIEHAENVSLALRLCGELGIPRARALAGMQASSPDPGALTIENVVVYGQRLCFINGFAANDPESTGQVWELALRRSDASAKKIALFNCRADRPERSIQLAEAAVTWTEADEYVVAGTGTNFFVSAAKQAGIPARKLHVVEGESAEPLAKRLVGLSGSGGVAVGLGNIGGIGLGLIEVLRELTEERQ